jgi:hypothetical protein
LPEQFKVAASKRALPTPVLKVFQARFGFYDSVVAAPSQAAALRAWGVHRNLFATGEAGLAADDAARAAAAAQPGTPLRRPIGTNAPFELNPAGLPDIPADRPRLPKAPPVSRHNAKTAAPAPAKPLPDRSALNTAEHALRGLEKDRQREEADLQQQADALEMRRQAAQSAYVAARKAATAKISVAREAYRKNGGRD